MSDALPMDVMQAPSAAEAILFKPTPLAAELIQAEPSLPLALVAGTLTPGRFTTLESELKALTQACGICDFGWMTQISVRGEDRLRWLSGMVTNAVQQLQDGEGNYSFFLNAQGRIQGDALVFREAEQVLLKTDADQAAKLVGHLDQFIIMDDVVLENPGLDTRGEQLSSIGVAGPKALDLLAEFQAEPPLLAAGRDAALKQSRLCGMPIYLATVREAETLRYEIWCGTSLVATLWGYLLSAGAQACGRESMEALRILQGIPRYGVDIADRDLPQETSQMRALNFTKGCYLGQEIVERIRSRGAVHRGLRQFAIAGSMPSLPCELMAGGTVIGKLTSAAAIPEAENKTIYALGIVRTDSIPRGEPLTYNGGTAVALERPPVFPS